MKALRKANEEISNFMFDNNIVTNIPLANFGIFNKSRLRYKQNSQNTDTRYGKNFSQERYLMKKKQANFKCQNKKFIC